MSSEWGQCRPADQDALLSLRLPSEQLPFRAQLLCRVPEGKVTTYGAMAAALSSAPRAVGQVRTTVTSRVLLPRKKLHNAACWIQSTFLPPLRVDWDSVLEAAQRSQLQMTCCCPDAHLTVAGTVRR